MKISIEPSERRGFDTRNNFLYLLLGLCSLSRSLLDRVAAFAGEPEKAATAAPPAAPAPAGDLLR